MQCGYVYIYFLWIFYSLLHCCFHVIFMLYIFFFYYKVCLFSFYFFCIYVVQFLVHFAQWSILLYIFTVGCTSTEAYCIHLKKKQNKKKLPVILSNLIFGFFIRVIISAFLNDVFLFLWLMFSVFRGTFFPLNYQDTLKSRENIQPAGECGSVVPSAPHILYINFLPYRVKKVRYLIIYTQVLLLCFRPYLLL